MYLINCKGGDILPKRDREDKGENRRLILRGWVVRMRGVKMWSRKKALLYDIIQQIILLTVGGKRS